MMNASQRIDNAYAHYEEDPCAKTALILARLVGKSHYNPEWACHLFFYEGHWLGCPWKLRWYGALLSSLNKNSFICKTMEHPLFSRAKMVGAWTPNSESLYSIVKMDQYCPIEWGVLGTYLETRLEPIQGMRDFVAMWEPSWSLAVPIYESLGWKKGLALLYCDMKQNQNHPLEKMDISTLLSMVDS